MINKFAIFVLIFSSSAIAKGHFGNLEGAFVLLDSQSKEMKIVNERLARKRMAPCSTFKVPNSVFGLESGYVSGKDFKLKYDANKNPKKKFWPKNWDRDHDLASAMKNSVVWYYQEIARNIGPKKMKEFLSEAKFGNSDISGGIDRFWLRSSLKISPVEQVQFWDQLFSYQFPFERTNIDLVNDLIVQEQNDSYVLRAKTGTCMEPNGGYSAWWVGSVYKAKRKYFFSIFLKGKDYKKLRKARKRIAKKYLADFHILH